MTPPPGFGPPHGRGRGRHRGRRSRSGVGRGDVRIAVLTLLAEEPMHGYQIMNELADRTNGAWRPSPGSIYPLLQQLADEGMVSSSREQGRNVFSLTEDGQTLAAESAGDAPIWERFAATDSADLREGIGMLAAAAKQVATTGTVEQVTKASEILSDARKRLYQLLAE